jgi:hypothetical protein
LEPRSAFGAFVLVSFVVLRLGVGALLFGVLYNLVVILLMASADTAAMALAPCRDR